MFAEDGTPLGVRQKGPQELDIISAVKPLTKYAVTVTDPASIRYHLEKAIHLAFSGRPGPVWIDLPLDIQASNIDEKSLAPYQPEEAPEDGSQLREQVRSVIEKLNHSQRPFLLLGNGVRLAHAEQEFRELAALLEALRWASPGWQKISTEKRTRSAWGVRERWRPVAQTLRCRTRIFCSWSAPGWMFLWRAGRARSLRAELTR